MNVRLATFHLVRYNVNGSSRKGYGRRRPCFDLSKRICRKYSTAGPRKITRACIWHAASDGHLTMGREDLLCSRLESLAPSIVAATPRKERGVAQSSGFVTFRSTSRTVVASHSRHLQICASIAAYRFQRLPSGDRQHQAPRVSNCLPPSHPAKPTPPDLTVARTASGRASRLRIGTHRH
jgi:hypothetical protein